MTVLGGTVVVTVVGAVAVTVVGTVVVTVAVDGSVPVEESERDGAELSVVAELSAVTVWVTVLGADGDIESNGVHDAAWAARWLPAPVSSESIFCC